MMGLVLDLVELGLMVLGGITLASALGLWLLRRQRRSQ